MNSLPEIESTYRSQLQETQQRIASAKQQIYRIALLRISVFAGGVVATVYAWPLGAVVVVPVMLLFLVAFLYLVKVHNRCFYKKDYLEKKAEVNAQELQALGYDFSAFNAGEEYIDPAHSYSYDLDLFGNSSLFQSLNRTVIRRGELTLAEWMKHPLLKKEAIINRQEAVQELTANRVFRQKFRVLGLLYKGKLADEDEIRQWAQSPSRYYQKRVPKLLSVLIPVANAITLSLLLLDVIPASLFVLQVVIFALASTIYSRNITKIQSVYGAKMQILNTYSKLIELIENQSFRTANLGQLQLRFKQGNHSACLAVHKLSKLLNGLDQRNNILVAFVLNGLMFWELRQMMRIEAWKEAHASQLPDWLDALGEMDAYCSLATFAYNHPDYVYPRVAVDTFCMKATAMGHPLMRRDKCVRNDVCITAQPAFLVVTGANMAGKSTYLRTVGVNYLMACAGFPVWADEMEVYPAQLATSLRTTDSLNENESYFFAELKRLKSIIDRRLAGDELFIILDEILKGTNSIDKQKGSLALIKQFMTLQVNGIIATHDLQLGTLADVYPGQIKNYCFEADITHNELTFSYRVREGVAQNMNACFLMKKMGIAIA